MKRGLAAIVFSLSLALGFTPSSASEHKEEKKGACVNYAHRFHPGTGLPEEMHKNPQEYKNKVLGFPKKTLHQALSLGNYGEVIIGYVNVKNEPRSIRCFVDREGWDIGVHEPRVPINREETIEAYVTQDPVVNEKTKWHYLGEFSVEGTKDNLIRIDMKDIKFAYWIKLKDAGSMLMPTGPQAGFEASAVYIRKLGLCGLNLM